MTFNTPMNEGLWLIIEGSNVNEATDYLRENALWPIALGIFTLIFWFFLYKKVKLESPLISSKKIRYGMLFLIVIPLFHTFKGRHNIIGEFNHHFTESYPFNAIFSYGAAQEDLKRFKQKKDFENINELKVFHPGPDDQTVVVVIGESSRKDRLQLFGSPVPNNAELSKISHEIFLFDNLITLHPHTVASLPVIFSKQTGINDNFKLNYSFLDVFKTAGYKTFWISNQASLFGKTNMIGRFSESADFRFFFHLHSSSSPTKHDGAILDLFKEKMSDKSSKKLFVLHLQGSHYSFDKRYPSHFKRFDDKYDNTLLYTDYILAEVVKTLKEEERKSLMFYVADHGLLLNECGKKHSHFDNKESFEVPAILWTSNEWKLINSEKLEILRNNQNKPLTTQVVFDSLLGLSGIQYSDYDLNLSIINQNVDVGKRLVKTYSGTVDYDLAQNDSSCHLREVSGLISDNSL